MKLTFLSILFFAVGVTAHAQITLEHTYPAITGDFSVIQFTSNGEKLMANDTGTSQVKLYNTDYTLWKTINIPVITGYKFYYAYLVSDNLFNSDNSVELVAIYYPISGGSARGQVINETGAVLQDLGNTYYVQVHIIDGVYKLECLGLLPGTGDYTVSMYSLPGTMPCGQCGSLGVNKTANASGQQIVISNPVPNPSSGSTRINFTIPLSVSNAQLMIYNSLGQTIKEIPLFNNMSFVDVNTSNLIAGIYNYNIVAESLISDTKKLLVR